MLDTYKIIKWGSSKTFQVLVGTKIFKVKAILFNYNNMMRTLKKIISNLKNLSYLTPLII